MECEKFESKGLELEISWLHTVSVPPDMKN